MNELIDIFEKQLELTDTKFLRSLMNSIKWKSRLIGIRGARGVGKTTLMLQYIKLHLADELDRVLYTSLDYVWFNNHRLIDLANEFEKHGGKYLFLDEVHKYPNWSQELKNIYDTLPGLQVVFTGSSLLEILNARADLSRRAVVYHMQGLSFREYICLESGLELPRFSLKEILDNHTAHARKLLKEIRPFEYFDAYLKNGYYPFYKENIDLYYLRIAEVLNLMLEIELPLLRGVDIAFVNKIRQLLSVIAESVPFSPNISKLSQKIGLSRVALLTYFHYLDEIGLTINLFKESGGISQLQKPQKTYLENTNLMYLLAKEHTNTGNLRETFFLNQLIQGHKVNYIAQTDFMVDDTVYFEIGGKSKTTRQLNGLANAYTVLDDIEIGRGNSIPLWQFGFLY